MSDAREVYALSKDDVEGGTTDPSVVDGQSNSFAWKTTSRVRFSSATVTRSVKNEIPKM